MNKLMTIVLAPVTALFLGTSAIAVEPSAARHGRIDINTATEDQLKTLPGVSAQEARDIVAARPYAKKDELKSKKVIPADTFEKIQRLIDSVC
jgi:DNA uptake protein ComE-like DNA-binding protein